MFQASKFRMSVYLQKIQFTSLNIKCRLFVLYSVEYRLQGLAND